MPSVAEQLSQWVMTCVESTDSREKDNSPTCEAYRSLLVRNDIRAGHTVIIAMPSGLSFLHAIAATLWHGARAVLAPNCLSWERLHELGINMGASVALTNRLSASNKFSADYIKDTYVQRLQCPPSHSNQGDIILLTSGTSGHNSGCLFNMERLLLNAHLHSTSIGLKSDDRILAILPLNYSFAFVAQVLASFVCKAALVVGHPPFSVSSFYKYISEQEVTVTSLTPFFIRALINNGQPFPRNLRVLTVGGDHLPEPDTQQLLRMRPTKELYLTYGLTEAGPRVTTLAAHSEPAARLSSVGTPLSGVRTFLEDTASDGSGLLAVQTPTAAMLSVGAIDSQKGSRLDLETDIVHTGDVFRIDADGYHYFLGRSADFMIQRGNKICLSSIRRKAASLRYVRKVRTLIIDNNPDVGRYQLLLYADPANLSNLASEAKKLILQLRPAERPASIEFLSAGLLEDFGGKI